MRYFKILIPFLFLLVFFTGCNKEEVPKYNLNIISPTFEQVYEQYSQEQNETNKYVLQSANEYSELLSSEKLPLIESVTICDDNISDTSVQEIIDLCKSKNIPVFFMMNDINKDILKTYDKAFCISADYTYIGEAFASYINNIWKNEIKDRDDNKIFTFSVIKPENLSNVQQTFYESLLKNIELLGIPLQQLDEIYLSKGDIVSYCEENKKDNEAFFILDSSSLSLFPDNYTPYGDGVEILGIDFASQNSYTDFPYIKICLIDYTDYFDTRNIILQNIQDKIYPFENLELDVIDKTIYINPVI